MLIIENLGASSQDTILSELDILLLHPIIQNMCICFLKKGGVNQKYICTFKNRKFSESRIRESTLSYLAPRGTQIGSMPQGKEFYFPVEQRLEIPQSQKETYKSLPTGPGSGPGNEPYPTAWVEIVTCEKLDP